MKKQASKEAGSMPLFAFSSSSGLSWLNKGDDTMRLRADRREERRKEAEERNQKWAQLTTSEKILSLSRRPGQSKRQMKKLEVQHG
jgi:hypothetical protein